MNDEQLIWEAYIRESQKDPKKEMIQTLMQNGNINEADAERLFNHYLTYKNYAPERKPILELDPVTNSYKARERYYNDLITDPKKIHKAFEDIKKHESFIEFYHAGPKLLKVKDIEFNLGALGFHIGGKKLVDFIHKKGGYFYDKDTSKLSKFLVTRDTNRVCPGKEIVEVGEDLPWEDAVQLAIYLFYVDVFNKSDAIACLNHFGFEDNRPEWYEKKLSYEPDYEDDLFTALDNIENNRYSDDYHPVQDIGIMSPHSDFYKDKESLEYLQKYLVNKGIAAIEYENEAEGTMVGEYEISLCVLDKCILKDV